MKMTKKEKIYVFFIILLSVMLAALFYVCVSGILYKDSALSSLHLKLGESAVVEIQGNQTQTLSYNFDGAWLSGQMFKQNLSIRNTGEEDLHLRAKIVIFTGDNNDPEISLIPNESWVLEEDGYLYCNDSVTSLSSVGLSKGLQISEETQVASRSNYIITLQVESLSTRFDRKSVWGY